MVIFSLTSPILAINGNFSRTPCAHEVFSRLVFPTNRSSKNVIICCRRNRSRMKSQQAIPCFLQVFFRLVKVSPHRRPLSDRVLPLIFRLMTYSRISRSLRLLCRVKTKGAGDNY